MKDNSHKVTTSVAQMGETDIMPAMPSKEYPEVAQDRQKMKMLTQNIQMMSYELHRLCQRFRITKKLDKDTDLTEFPENQRDFLKTAIGCVTNAQKTFDDFRDFLVEEKYAEWAEEQKRLRNATVKAMIGEMPKGTPHKVATMSGGAEEAEAAADEGKASTGLNLFLNSALKKLNCDLINRIILISFHFRRLRKHKWSSTRRARPRSYSRKTRRRIKRAFTRRKVVGMALPAAAMVKRSARRKKRRRMRGHLVFLMDRLLFLLRFPHHRPRRPWTKLRKRGRLVGVRLHSYIDAVFSLPFGS